MNRPNGLVYQIGSSSEYSYKFLNSAEYLYQDIRKIYLRTRNLTRYIVVNYNHDTNIIKYIGFFIYQNISYNDVESSLLNILDKLYYSYNISFGNKKKSEPIVMIFPKNKIQIDEKEYKDLLYRNKSLMHERRYLFTLDKIM